MAYTEKGVYYQTDYDEDADILEDMKKMAESVDEVVGDIEAAQEVKIETLQSESGHTIELTLDNTTYILTAKLKNRAGTVLNTQTVDFPVESMVTNMTYDSETKELVITLQSGVTRRILLSDIIDGLVNEKDFEEFKGQVEEEMTALQEKNEALESRVAEMEENELTATPEKSTSYHIVDSAKAKFRRFLPEGHSEQETTEGYNKLDLEKYSYNESGSTLNGAIVTIKDGVITINATNATGNATALSVGRNSSPDVLEAGPYYFGVDVFGAYESTPDTNVWQFKGNRTLTEKFYIKQWKFSVTQGNTGSTPIIISNDTSKTTYEKYTNGASPNPSYEQPIKSAGENVNKFDKDAVSLGYIDFRDGTFTAYNTYTSSDFIEIEPNFSYYCNWTPYTSTAYGLAYYDSDKQYLSGSKLDVLNNVIPPVNNAKYIRFCVRNEGDKATDINQLYLKKGTTPQPYSPYGMGSITERIVNKNWFDIVAFENQLVSGKIINDSGNEVSDSTSQYSKYFMFLKANKQYYIKGAWQRMYFYDKNKVFKSRSTAATGMDRTYTPTENEYIRFQISTDYWNNNKGQEQVELGSTATDYVPHEEQTKTYYTQQPFRSIGDVRDCFVKKSDGWYERHKIKRLIFDGTENWQFDPSHYRFLILLSESQLSTNRSGKSNYFKIGNTETTNNCFSFSTTAVLFRVDETITSKADAKSWVATKYADGRPLYTDYILAEPLDLPCTETQIQQLENPPSTYKIETNVFSEDEIEAYIDAEYVIDTKTYIDNKIESFETRLEALESEV